MRFADDPLVTRDRSEIKKMPMMVQFIADGWFVKTHSNTYTKMEFLRRMADTLNVKLTFERFRRESVAMPTKKRGRGRPPKKPLLCGEKTVPSLFPEITAFESDPIMDEPKQETKSETTVPAPFALTSDAAQPSLFDRVETKDIVVEKTPAADERASDLAQVIPSYALKASLRREMKRLYYTPRSLAAGLHLPHRLVKSWYKGLGALSPNQYKAFCKHLAVEKLEMAN